MRSNEVQCPPTPPRLSRLSRLARLSRQAQLCLSARCVYLGSLCSRGSRGGASTGGLAASSAASSVASTRCHGASGTACGRVLVPYGCRDEPCETPRCARALLLRPVRRGGAHSTLLAAPGLRLHRFHRLRRLLPLRQAHRGLRAGEAVEAGGLDKLYEFYRLYRLYRLYGLCRCLLALTRSSLWWAS